MTPLLFVFCTVPEAIPFEDRGSGDVTDEGVGDVAGNDVDATDSAADGLDDGDAADQATDPGVDVADDGGAGDVSETGDLADGGATDVGDGPGSGTWEDPWRIASFPFEHASDTSTSSVDVVDGYACAPSTNEAGPEVVYRVQVPSDGILSVAVDDSAVGVDVDVHLLELDGETCRARHNTGFYEVVFEGDALLVVVDTWVNGGGVELAGAYTLIVDLEPLPGGDCALVHGAIEMINRTEPLMLPAVGAVVLEAHLVTTEEFPGTWPQALRDGIEAHYTLTEAASGYEMERSEPWAPEGEGGSEWGQGSTSRPPPVDETWYVNMYWRNRPARGTRMLVYNPENGRAVVGAAGYETGPGSATRLGGATEEIHHALGTTHGSRALMGFLDDQELPFGVIDCE